MPRLTRQKRNQRLALLAVGLLFVVFLVLLPLVNYFTGGETGPKNSNLDRANAFRGAPVKK